MENSHISWTDHTFNPWIGCTKVSPGCVHCYAEARDQRFAGGAHWGNGAPRQRTSENNWKSPLRWNRDEPVTRPRVFCASLADWLDDEVPVEWLADLLDLIRCTPNLDWLLLTKRPENWLGRVARAMRWMGEELGSDWEATFTWAHDWLADSPPRNVWVGTTVEDQTRAHERIPLLLGIPSFVRFLSCEPLLGPVGLIEWLGNPIQQAVAHHHRTGHEGGGCGYQWDCEVCDAGGDADDPPKLHWIICGGESGPGARPMDPEWARSLRDQCAAAGVAYHFKQWGGPDNKERGRLLDGALHDALPRLSNEKGVGA